MNESITIIKEKFESAAFEKLEQLIAVYKEDTRAGVQRIVCRAEKKIEDIKKEKKRTKALWEYELKYASFHNICGIDEVGRGPLAGPVVAAAVILPKNCDILYINDSKKLSEKKREELYELIMEQAVAVGIGQRGPERIDEINILQATYEAMQEAISNLSVEPDILLNDAVTIPSVTCPQVPIIKGDAKSISIGAASIIAKVTRDRWMMEYHKQFPQYGFDSNKGYGSKAHIEALKALGATPLHRKSFISNLI